MYTKVAASALLMAARYNAFSPADVENLLAGLVEGLIQKDDLAKIQVCLTDASGLEVELQDAITDFMKGDLQDILAGVEILGKVVQELPADLGDCQAMQGDIDRIEKWASVFSDPTTLVRTLLTNIFENFSTISADISKTSTDIAAGDYMNVGEDVADIMVAALGPVPAAEDIESLVITQW